MNDALDQAWYSDSILIGFRDSSRYEPSRYCCQYSLRHIRAHHGPVVLAANCVKAVKPTTGTSQAAASGLHWTQNSRPLTANAILVETIINQINSFNGRSVNPRNVIAKAVLLHARTVIVKVARTAEGRRNLARFSGGKSQV